MNTFFSHRFKKLREHKKISQNDMAKFLKTAQSTIAKWEAGSLEPSMTMLLKIANFFNIDINYLFGTDIKTITEWHLAHEKAKEEYFKNYYTAGIDETGYFTNYTKEELAFISNDEETEREFILHEYLEEQVIRKKLKELFDIEPEYKQQDKKKK